MATSLKDQILAELEISQCTAESLAVHLGESQSSITTVLRNLVRAGDVVTVDHPRLIIYRHNLKATKNNPTPP